MIISISCTVLLKKCLLPLIPFWEYSTAVWLKSRFLKFGDELTKLHDEPNIVKNM